MSLYGVNTVANGTFDTTASWDVDAGNNIVIALGKCTADGPIIQDITSLVTGVPYKVTFDVVAGTPTGNPYVSLGGDTTTNLAINVAGLIGSSYSATLIPTGANTQLRFWGDGGIITDNVTVTEVFPFNDGDYIGVYYNIDDAGWVYAGAMNVTDDYKEQPFYINRTGKRIKFKFAGRGGNFQIREYQIMEPGIEDDR